MKYYSLSFNFYLNNHSYLFELPPDFLSGIKFAHLAMKQGAGQILSHFNSLLIIIN